MANEQAWLDFKKIIKAFIIIPGKINELGNRIDELKELKIEIFDDGIRRAELEGIIDIHPLYTLPALSTEFQKIIDLQTFLVDNGYLP